MIGYIIFVILVFIISLFVYIEYKNEKKYKEERREKRPDAKRETKAPVTKPRKVLSAKEIEEQEKRKKEKQRELEEKRFKEIKLEEKKLEEKKPEPKVIPEPIEKIEKVDLPECNYPKFDHSRLMDMGLSPEEAKEFVVELIPQIEAQIPLLKEAIASVDFDTVERLTHSIKGSSTTVGTGGIADLIIDFNTYVKTGTEPAIAEAYLKHLNHYYEDLKRAYT